MADDILQQAALRQRQRPKTGRRQNAESLEFNAEKISIQDEASNNDYPITPRGQSRRERIQSNFTDLENSNDVGIPCFIECKIGCDPSLERPRRNLPGQKSKIKVQNTPVKALINTSMIKSSVNRKVAKNIRTSAVYNHTQDIEITFLIGGSSFTMPLLLNDDIPDIVLGVDFLKRHKGILDFYHKALHVEDRNGTKMSVNFLNSQEVPLRFRSNKELGSSI